MAQSDQSCNKETFKIEDVCSVVCAVTMQHKMDDAERFKLQSNIPVLCLTLQHTVHDCPVPGVR
eukprot:1136157-Pelagomonas_calceolata.AAC.7